jgi:ribosomal protein S18 acetylase RimI-like enzyme
MNSGELDDSHVDALAAFFARLPESDITFIKEDLSATSLQSWVSPGRSGHRWVATDDLCVVGFVALLPLSGWSSHVGDLRLVVDPDQRGRGIGRRLAQLALREAVSMGLRKVTVEVIAAQEGTIAMFNNLGFNGEALLEDHIRDRKGEFQDLVLLSHRVDESWAAMITAGIDEALAD